MSRSGAGDARLGSIRRSLHWRLLLGTAVVLGLAGTVVYFVLRGFLAQQVDVNLEDRLQGLASLLFQQKEVLGFEFSGELMPEYERESEPAFFQLWFEDGRLIERSDSLRGTDLKLPDGVGAVPTFWSLELLDDRTGRAAAQVVEVHHVYPEEGPDRPEAARVLICVAKGDEERLAAERIVLWSCAATAAALLGLLSLCALRAVRQGLEPTDRLARTIASIDPDRLPAELEFGPVPEELLPVARTTRDLVTRLEEALQRERRTTASIAHELRTPISELITVSEVALLEDEAPEAQREAIETLRGVAWKMGRTVSLLLKLARLESEEMSEICEPVDLGELVRAVHQGCTLANNGEGPVVVFDLSAADAGEARVDVDPEALSIVVTNLLENALHYTQNGATVDVRVQRGATGWELVIENDAEGLSTADVERFSEPFWRKDGARADRDRSGLGLALARAVAEQSGLEIKLELAGQRVRATLTTSSQSMRE